MNPAVKLNEMGAAERVSYLRNLPPKDLGSLPMYFTRAAGLNQYHFTNAEENRLFTASSRRVDDFLSDSANPPEEGLHALNKLVSDIVITSREARMLDGHACAIACELYRQADDMDSVGAMARYVANVIVNDLRERMNK